MKMTTANKLTILRILMIPVFMYFVYKGSDSARVIAMIIFIVASFTDTLDGYIARKYNQVTNFGKIFDPIADKVLVLAALIPLAELGLIPGWAVIILLAREFIVGGFRNVVAAVGGKVIAASIIGKLKTISQIVLICVLLVRDIWFASISFPFEYIFIVLAILLSLWSMADYIIGGVKELKRLGEA
jgi:CDP-diacylglycerol--glycerol-3-phosphate 3-phosphatidyltransferase